MAAKTIRDRSEWHARQRTTRWTHGKAVDAIDVPELPRLVADDVTPEAVASLLAECGGSIAVVSAEGGVFDIIAGRYNGNIPNMDVWLKGHSGDMIRVDRKGRPPEYIRKPAHDARPDDPARSTENHCGATIFPWSWPDSAVPVRDAGVACRLPQDRSRLRARRPCLPPTTP